MVDVAESLVTDMFQAKACYRKIFAVLVFIEGLAAIHRTQFMLLKCFVVARGKVKILKSENRQPWEMHREIQFQLTENMQRRFCTPFPL